MAEPLFRLLKKSRRFICGEEHQKSFELLKTALISALTLARPHFRLPFTLQADVSSTGLGILTQIIDGAEGVIAYAVGRWPPLR